MDARERPMYNWRRMTPEQRKEALEHRQQHQLPWHGPAHFEDESGLYLITAACFEHKSVIGSCFKRLAEFEKELLESIAGCSERVFGWNVLPNHYHVLLHAPDLKCLLHALGQLHGRTSFRWNGEEDCRGRKVWHRAAETVMKTDRHFWATLNYVLHNAVRHGYAETWQDWPFSNAGQYLDEVGREEAERRWREYPVLDYGADWDPPEL
jgi:putative transposase